jgi:YD repeat-containing protein
VKPFRAFLHAVVFVVLCVQSVLAQSPNYCTILNGGSAYNNDFGIEVSNSCWRDVGPPNRNDFPSVCWRPVIAGALTPPPQGWTGFGLNLDLWYGVAPSDYGPRKLDLAASSSPLVSRGVAHYQNPVGFLERPTLNSDVDLITGVPLIQEVDLVLPFGGATFRHVRTYSEVPGRGFTEQPPIPHPGPDCLYWDWTGQGWMTGEDPILLFDASYWSVVTAPQNPVRARCYFIPDAHHSIPFERIDPTSGTQPPKYIAPPQFDARMDVEGGVWDSQLGKWTTYPTTAHVWLNGKSIKYTIKLVTNADVATTAPNSVVSLHNSPTDPESPARGVPYWGYVTQIEDAYGHAIKIDYCDFIQFDRGDPPDGGTCKPCLQNCNEKGQVSRLRLCVQQPNSSQYDTIWTLLYTHRTFENLLNRTPEGDPPPPRVGPFFHSQSAINTIHVYRGEVSAQAYSPQPPYYSTCFSVNHRAFTGTAATNDLLFAPNSTTPLQILNARDDIDPVTIGGVPVIPEGWEYQIRYAYSEIGGGTFIDREGNQLTIYPRYDEVFAKTCPQTGLNVDTGSYPLYGPNVGSPRLLKSKLIWRPNAGDPAKPDVREVSHTLYRYHTLEAQNSLGASGMTDPVVLKAIYHPQAVRKIMTALNTENVNTLLLLDDGDLIGSLNATFGELASKRLWHWSVAESSEYGRQLDFKEAAADAGSPNCFARKMVTQFMQAPVDRIIALPDGVHMVQDAGDESGSAPGSQPASPVYKVYRFLQWPGEPDNWFQYGVFYRAVYHYPYRFVRDVDLPSTWTSPVGTDPLWITVIDKYRNLADCNADYSANASENDAPKPPLSRRIVWMNSVGAVLADQMWTGNGELQSTIGLLETYQYDEHNRLIEKRSTGWNSIANASTRDTAGLIQVYRYAPDRQVDGVTEFANEIEATGVKKGVQGTPYWTHATIRDPLRPRLVTKDVFFPDPVTDYAEPGAGAATDTYYTFVDANDPDSRIVGKAIVGPTAKRAPTGDNYYPVEKWQYDEHSNAIWHGYGTLATWETVGSGSGSGDEFHSDFAGYDGNGQLTCAVEDAVGGAVINGANGTVTVDQYPSGFGRHVAFQASSTALQYLTQYVYSTYGLQKVFHPNGRHDVNTYVVREDSNFHQVTERRAYKDLVSDGTGHILALSPVTVNRVQLDVNGWNVFDQHDLTLGDIAAHPTLWAPERVEHSEQGTLNTVLTSDPTGYEEYTVVASLDPTYDPMGRLSGVHVDGADGKQLDASVHYNAFNQVDRQQGPDGAIERVFFDNFGRPVYVFKGTEDGHEFWGNATSGPDNMVLVEKDYYSDGTSAFGTNDAGRVVQVRRYRNRPTNQYHETNLPSNTEDQDGWCQQRFYDWRMRPVWTRYNVHGEVGTAVALRHTVTYYDYLSRVRLVAEYGPDGPPTSPNPVALGPADSVPAASAILGVSAQYRPIALAETIYNQRGAVEEIRQYDPGDTTGNSYLASKTYYDHAGRTLYSVASNAPDEVRLYDAKGRVVSAATVASSAEQTRTDTIYDPDGNAIEVRSWERVGPTGATLDATNAVRTRTFNWYDLKNRLVATARLGTRGLAYTNEDSNAELSRASTPDPRQFNEGMLSGISAGAMGGAAKITGYHYDDKGRLARTIDPAGLVTDSFYDSLGELKEKRESTQSQYGLRTTRRTCYTYDAGRIEQISAVLVDPEHTWGSNPQDAQITRIAYGAPIINEYTGAVESCDNTLPAAVYFPDAGGALYYVGRPADLTFRYYPDGLLATRTDAKGNVFTYKYDELGNQASIRAQYPGAGSSPAPAPKDLIRDVFFQRDPLGKLLRATAWSTTAHDPPISSDYPVADTKWTYDTRGNLTSDVQEHGNPITANTPHTDYQWTYSPASSHDFDRLLQMVYPAKPYAVGRRTLHFDYGDNGASADSAFGRETRIADQLLGTIAAYAYTGGGKRADTYYGGEIGNTSYAVRQTVKAAGGGVLGFDGFDTHGRLVDQWFQRPTGANNGSVHHYQYGYDSADNLMFSRTEQSGHDNDRSSLFGYDKFGRLVQASIGQLDSSNASIETGGVAPTPRHTTWTLDTLGNWTGESGSSTPGRLVSGPYLLGGTSGTNSTTHSVGFDNSLLGMTTQSNGGPPLGTINVLDDNRNLVADSSYFYQYDAWNRLMKVSGRGSLTFDMQGQPNGGLPGPWITQYSYDGVGRLIRKVSPWPSDATAQRTEHFYYDGVRRIQEVVIDPLLQVDEVEPVIVSSAERTRAARSRTKGHRSVWSKRTPTTVCPRPGPSQRTAMVASTCGAPAAWMSSCARSIRLTRCSTRFSMSAEAC